MISSKKFFRVLLFWALFLFPLVESCTEGSSAPPYENGSSSSVQSPATPSISENLAQQAGVEKVIFHAGPIDLPAHSDIREMMDRPLTMRFQTDKEIWITGFLPKLVDASGAELPGQLLHEATISNAHEENPLCAGSPNPFFVANSILTEVELPKGYGYPVLPTDPIETRVVLKNPTDASYVNVFFEIALVTKPMSEFGNMSDVKPVLIEQNPCDHASSAVAPHTFDSKEKTYELISNAKLVAANALLGDYGSSVSLSKGDENQPFWKAEAELDGTHAIKGLIGNPLEDTEGISLNTGDRIKLTATYDNTSNNWLQAAAAGAIVYLSPVD